jgi:hypothetical protein
VLDRLIQQAIPQVLQPRFDPSFSAHSDGFRPRRGAHDAVKAAQRYVREGRHWVVDVDLEQRGHAFVRYADGGKVYLRSRRAGERVMAALERMSAKLRLRVNRAKSKVAPARKGRFLSYGFWYARGGAVMCRVAPKAIQMLQQRVRQITRRSGGRSLRMVVAELRSYLPSWKQYFQLADTPQIFADHDKWLRHRLRALQLKQWKRGATAFRELRELGVPPSAAAQAAAHTRR